MRSVLRRLSDAVGNLSDPLRATVHVCGRRGFPFLKPTWSAITTRIANRCQEPPRRFLIREGTVAFRGIETSYPHVECGSDHRNGALLRRDLGP